MKKILLAVLVSGIFIMLNGGSLMAFEIKSSAFKNNEAIPKEYTGEGANVSAPLSWDKVPEGTQEFALVCDDPDAPGGGWVHWLIYNIPADVLSLEKAIPMEGILENGIKQGKNDFGSLGYGGPMPPPGKAHRYFFKIYALKNKINLAPGLIEKELLEKIKGDILAETEFMGTYQR